jgi:hypothetical protein
VKKRITQENLWQTWAGAVVLVCVLAGFAGVLVVSHQTDQRFRRVAQYLYRRCLVYQDYNHAQTDARRAMIRDLDDRIEQERTNRFIDQKLRAARIQSAQTVKAALLTAVTAQPSDGCQQYLP